MAGHPLQRQREQVREREIGTADWYVPSGKTTAQHGCHFQVDQVRCRECFTA